MRTGQQEVYVTLVVVKRPAEEGWQKLTPDRWAQSVPDRLAVHGGQHGQPRRQRASNGNLARQIYLGLGMLCMGGAAWLFYLGSK